MSDPDSTLTPAQDDAVRELLASARHTDPTPSDVVARLDETLASLGEERRAELETRAPVVTLASRRRRTAATALLAAAAVVVFGVGIGQVLPSMTTDSDDSAGSAAETSTLAEDQLSDEDGADAKQGDAEMRTQSGAPAPSAEAMDEQSALTGDSNLKPQVRALRPAAPFTASYDAGADCLVEAQRGESVNITYDGRPGVLVYRVPAAGRQRVDVYVCGEPSPARSVRLRAP